MDEEEYQSYIFRKKSLDQISSPEQLTDYLRVTTPGIWMVLLVVIFLLSGVLAWSFLGTLETDVDATVIVEDHKAMVVISGGYEIKPGMSLNILEKGHMIVNTVTDEYGRTIGIADVGFPDGTYEGRVTVESMRPIDFLLTGR